MSAFLDEVVVVSDCEVWDESARQWVSETPRSHACSSSSVTDDSTAGPANQQTDESDDIEVFALGNGINESCPFYCFGLDIMGEANTAESSAHTTRDVLLSIKSGEICYRKHRYEVRSSFSEKPVYIGRYHYKCDAYEAYLRYHAKGVLGRAWLLPMYATQCLQGKTADVFVIKPAGWSESRKVPFTVLCSLPFTRTTVLVGVQTDSANFKVYEMKIRSRAWNYSSSKLARYICSQVTKQQLQRSKPVLVMNAKLIKKVCKRVISSSLRLFPPTDEDLVELPSTARCASAGAARSFQPISQPQTRPHSVDGPARDSPGLPRRPSTHTLGPELRARPLLVAEARTDSAFVHIRSEAYKRLPREGVPLSIQPFSWQLMLPQVRDTAPATASSLPAHIEPDIPGHIESANSGFSSGTESAVANQASPKLQIDTCTAECEYCEEEGGVIHCKLHLTPHLSLLVAFSAFLLGLSEADIPLTDISVMKLTAKTGACESESTASLKMNSARTSSAVSSYESEHSGLS